MEDLFMASSRSKSGAKSKPSRPAAKAKPAKKSAPPRGKTAVKKVATAKAKPAKAPPPPAKKPAPVPKVVAKVVPKVVAKPAAKPGKVIPKVVAKPASATAAAKGKKPALTPRRGATPENVRPIGMLPPENVARATHKPAPRPVVRPASTPPPARPHAQPKSTEGASRVTEKDFKEFEERLLQERRRILREMGHLETTVLKVNQRDSSGDLSGYSFHMADAGTDAMEREKAFLFASAEGRVLLEIDDALRRIYRGDYGNCETCGNPIARARLEVMPQARLCISCKEKEEREQRGAM
jgi:RNA polymerase-binding transcription factor DksA